VNRSRALVVPALVVPALAMLAIAGCGGGNDKKDNATKSTSTQKTTSTNGQTINSKGTKNVSGAKNVELEMDDFYFKPTVLKGTPGQKLGIELKNEGKVEHNLTITNQQIDKDVPAGGKAKVSITFPKSGTLSFFCKYHQAQGMRGSLQAGAGGGATSQGGSTGSASGGSNSGDGSQGSGAY
jgi:plastocyanin